MTSEPSRMPTIIVGVGAGIAAYKTVQVVRALRARGYEVFVVPSQNSIKFVGVQTWQELSENPVNTTVFHDAHQVGHIELARQADLILVAPCTANLAAKLRAGLADELLTTTVLASTAPKMLVPAMHSGMWENPATQDNFAVLAQRGMEVIPPASGALSSGDSGVGRMVEPQQIVDTVDRFFAVSAPASAYASVGCGRLSGTKVVISAGGTVEQVDPVRYLSNFSSGRQGVALANAAADLGADVTLLAAKCEVPLPNHPNIEVVRTLSALDMAQQVRTRLTDTDILVMAAAVADYRPQNVANGKLKKESWGENPIIRLVRNPDILHDACNSPDRPSLVIGFAAETGNEQAVLTKGQEKARFKGADLLAINKVGDGQGFGNVDNELWVVDRQGVVVSRLSGDKESLAEQLLTLAAQF